MYLYCSIIHSHHSFTSFLSTNQLTDSLMPFLVIKCIFTEIERPIYRIQHSVKSIQLILMSSIAELCKFLYKPPSHRHTTHKIHIQKQSFTSKMNEAIECHISLIIFQSKMSPLTRYNPINPLRNRSPESTRKESIL